MTTDVNVAFDTLVGRIVPSETETTRAASHRASIKDCLERNFGLTGFFRAGSFGHGTSVRGYSDVDYFAVIPASNLNDNSATALRHVKEALAIRFPNTPVWVDSPAVAVQFGTEKWERHEITPVYLSDSTKSFNIYGMPNRYGAWMASSPVGLNAVTNAQNDRLNKRAKQLVRLVKLWNYYAEAGIRSIYIEMRVIEYLKNESSVVYPIDVAAAFRHMLNKELASMRDPIGLGASIFPCTDAAKATALSRLNTALTRAEKATSAEHSGYSREAFDWWDKVYFGSFPAYY